MRCNISRIWIVSKNFKGKDDFITIRFSLRGFLRLYDGIPQRVRDWNIKRRLQVTFIL